MMTEFRAEEEDWCSLAVPPWHWRGLLPVPQAWHVDGDSELGPRGLKGRDWPGPWLGVAGPGFEPGAGGWTLVSLPTSTPRLPLGRECHSGSPDWEVSSAICFSSAA